MKQNKIPKNEYIIQPKGKTNPYKHDVIYSNLGQWKYPGQVTRIPSNQITMQGVPYPVQGVDDTGYSQMMYPGMDYTFPGQYVTEYPMARYGGGLPKAQLGRIEQNINSWLGEPMAKAKEASAGGKWFNPKTKQLEQEDDIDNFRHPMAARYTSEAIANKFPNWMQYSGIPQAAGFLGSAGLGVGHELSSNKYTSEDPGDYPNYTFWDTISEAGEDILNNTVGAGVGALPISANKKTSFLRYLSDNNMLPDGVANNKGNMYFKPFGGQNTKTHTHMAQGGWLDTMQVGGSRTDVYTDKVLYDKAYKAEMDSVAAHNLTLHDPKYDFFNSLNVGMGKSKKWDEKHALIGTFEDVNEPDKKAKVFTTKNRVPIVWSERDKNYLKFLKQTKLKPEYYKNLKEKSWYIHDIYNYVTDNKGEMKVVKPSTPFIEDQLNRKAIKKEFPKATDAFINERIKQQRKNDPHYKGKVNILPDGSYNPEEYNYGPEKDFHRIDAMSENIYDWYVSDAIPYWKKPVVHNVYQPPEQEFIEPIQIPFVPEKEKEPNIAPKFIFPKQSNIHNRISWRMDPETRKMVPVYLQGRKQKVKKGKRLYNEYIPTSTMAIPEDFEPQFDRPEIVEKTDPYWRKEYVKPKNVATKQMGGWLDELPEAQIGRIVKAGLKGIKKLNPVRVADKVIPQVGGLVNPAVLMGVESMNAMSMSPLNWIPGYGQKLKGTDQAFRKFGNSIDDVIERQALSPKGRTNPLGGTSSFVDEGNWAAMKEPNEKYSGVFLANMNPEVKGSNIKLSGIKEREGVVGTTRDGNVDIPLNDEGLSFYRRLPFSNKYTPINKEKLIKKEFDLARTAPHLQSLAEKALGAAGVIAVHDYIQGDNKSDWFPQIKNQLDKSYNKVSKYVGPYLPKEEDGGNIQQAQFGKIIKTVTKAISKPVIKKAVVNKKYVLPSKEKIKDLHGFIRRRQFIEEMQKEGLIGKDFKDLNYAASSTDKTNALTKLALDRKATRYRGVEGKVPENGIARQQSHPYQEYDMSKPAQNNDISEFENMKNAGVDFNDPISIAKYQATHIPMQQYGYRSGMPYMSNVDALYSGHAPTGYGNYQIKITSPRDYSEGNYIDWVKKYHNPKNNLQDLAVKDGYYIKDFVPNTSYEMPVGLNKTDLTTVVGKRGQKMFDVDDTFPFMNYKKLSPKQELEFKDYVKGLGEDYNTGWKGKYKKGGWLDDMQVGGYKSEADYQAHLLDPYSSKKRAAQQSWLNQKKNNSLRSQMSKDNTSVRKPNILSANELAYAQPHQKLSKEDQMAMYVDSAIANRQPDELRETKKQGFGNKAHEVVMNPFKAAGYLSKYGRLPDNFSEDGETNALDFAPGFINPLYYLEAAYNTGKAAFDPETYKDLGKTVGLGVTALAGDQSPDEWKQAGFNTLFKGLDASMVKGAGKMIGKNAKRIINTNINKTSKNIKKGLEEQAGKYYQNAPGKMEGLGNVKDINEINRMNQYGLKAHPDLFSKKYQTAKDAKQFKYHGPNNPSGRYVGPTEGDKLSGFTDVPSFNEKLNKMMTTASFGKRPLTTDIGVDREVSKNALMEALDNARYEEGITDLIPTQYMKKAKIPYNAKKAFQNIQPNKYGGDLQEAQWGKIVKAGAKAILKPVAKVIKPVVKPVLKTLNTGLTHGKNAIRKIDEKVVIPIQFRKDIKKIKESAKTQHEYFQKPEVVEKLKSIKASPIAIRALQTPNQVDLTFKTGHGSYFDQLPGIINMDMRQMKEASERFAMTPQQVYEHELGHQIQQYINIGSPEFQQAYAKYVRQLEDYNIRKEISNRVAGKSTKLNPMAVRSKPDFLVNWNMPEAPKRLSKPTILDKQAAGMLRLKSKDKKTMTPEELNSLYYYHSEVPADGISKIGYNIEKGTERLPHLREMRQSMIDNGYIPDVTSPITEDVIRRFIKENPKNRIASIVDPTFQTNYKKLVKTFKHLPAVLPIGLGTAAALQNEEYKRGGQKGLKKYTSKNIATSVNDIMLRNETLFGPAGKKRYKPGLKYKSGGGLLDKYQDTGEVVPKDNLNEDQQFLINMVNSPLFNERYAKMTGQNMPIPYAPNNEESSYNLNYPADQYKKDIINNINTVKYAPKGEGDFDPKNYEGEIIPSAYYVPGLESKSGKEFKDSFNNLTKNSSKFNKFLFKDEFAHLSDKLKELEKMTHKIYISDKENRPYTRTHETSHASTKGELNTAYPYNAENRNPYKNFGKKYEDYHDSQYDNPIMQKYLSQPSEIKARVDAARKYMMDKGLYDPINKKFTDKEYNKLLRITDEDNINDLKHNFSKEDIIRMFNEIVTNKPKTQPVAKMGGWLDNLT